MSQEERELWIAYYAKRGPLNPHWRLDAAIARLARIVGAAAGVRITDKELMPWADLQKDDPDYIATPEDLQAMFGAKVRKH